MTGPIPDAPVAVAQIAPPPIAALAAYAALHADAMAEDAAAGAPWNVAAFADFAATREVFWTCATAGEALVGFACMRVVADEAELLAIARAPRMRGLKLGSRLLSLAMNTVYRLGAGAVFLEVGALNRPALDLYERLGFRGVGRRPGYYRTSADRPQDALILSKSLTKD